MVKPPQKPTIHLVPITAVVPNPQNPRTIKDAAFQNLVQSLKEFPQMMDLRPVIVNADMMILGGNQRYKAAVEAGWENIPILVAEGLTPEQEAEFIVKDNGQAGEWDFEALASLFDTDQLLDWGVEFPKGFFDTPEEETPKEENEAPYKSQYGVIVICPDETEQEAVFNKLQGMGYECKIVVT